MEKIENKAIKIAKNTLQFDNIDLCYVVIDKKYCNIIYKNIIQSDIITEELEDYLKINNHIHRLNGKELRNKLHSYAEDIFLNILKYKESDAYFEIIEYTVYDNYISWIFEAIRNNYKNGYTIYTTNNSFLLHGSYTDAIATDFQDNYYILNKDTKLFLIDEIENSDYLSEEVKKEIIENIKNY